MRVTLERTEIPDLAVVTPDVFRDDRGFFMEVFREDVFREAGLPTRFVQVNHSGSARHVLRGLHFQWDPPMGKLMRVTRGDAFLVAVDIRPGSPTLGRWHGVEATASCRTQVWAPAGFARGFLALSEQVEIEYLTTGIYNPAAESAILWCDTAIGIDWPVSAPLMSDKDRRAGSLAEWLDRPEAEAFRFSEPGGADA